MQELYRYEVSDRDIQETFRVLSRCPGSRIFRRALRLAVLSTLAYLGVLAWAMYRTPASAYRNMTLLIYLALTPLGVALVWVLLPGMQAAAQLSAMHAQKKAAGLDPAAPELHSICLDGTSYVRRIEQRASTAVPLASLRAARPVKNGGVVLLFNTEADDYLPARLFSPAYTAGDLCRWIDAQAAEARKTPLTLSGTGQSTAQAAKAGTAVHLLRFTLDAEEAIRLLSRGCRGVYLTAAYLRQLVLLVLALGAVLLVPFILCLGLETGLLTLLMLGGGFLLLCLIGMAYLSSRAAYRRQLRKGELDRLLGPQQVEFYEDRITVCRAAGQYDQGYAFYAQLLDTPDAWFLVSQGATGILPLPKESLPEHQHAGFAAFVREKLAAAKVRQGHGPAKKL